MRENTLIVFHSDNGGVTSSIFAGDTKVAGSLPANNGSLRDGKGTLYEGGTRVVALANWPGRIKPGVVEEMIHVVDMYPTLARLAGAVVTKSKPLDGVDVWSTLAEGKPSPRSDGSCGTPGRLETGLEGGIAVADRTVQSPRGHVRKEGLSRGTPRKGERTEAANRTTGRRHGTAADPSVMFSLVD
jgi:hypothetical protein